MHVNEDGSVTAATGSPDIGGSRASMGMMVAEVLGLKAEKVRTIVADTGSIGFTFLTGGSRVTFATGMAVTQAAEKVVEDLKKRASMIWEIPVDAVEWKDGMAFPAGSNAGAFEPLDLAAIALKAGRTGGPINAEVSVNAQGAGAGFGAHICDVTVDKETGHVTVERYTAIQDVGEERSTHPSYVEGQIQGGAVQGIGWSAERGAHLQRPRANWRTRASWITAARSPRTCPMIEAVLVEVPNPRHPFRSSAWRGRGAGSSHPWRRSVMPSAAPPACACPIFPCHPPRSARRSMPPPNELISTGPKVIIASGGSCHQFTGGKTEFDVEASTFRQLVRELETKYPGLGKQVEESMAVAIDGEIYQDAYHVELKPGSEIVLIPKIGGG